MNPKETQKILQAGQIAKQVKEFAKSVVKKDKSLFEIAEQIENKIIELGGKPAFPTNLSINDIAAHYTPSYDDKTKAHGLLKIDLGVHIDGFIADTAFSVDLENSEENQKLIQASQEALENAIKLIKEKSSSTKYNGSEPEQVQGSSLKNKLSDNKLIVNNPIKTAIKVKPSVKKDNILTNKKISEQSEPNLMGGRATSRDKNEIINERGWELGGVTTSEIGSTIQETIESHSFSPIINLSGHSMEKYDLHSGITIPNINDKKNIILKSGLYAIEPFATSGNGKVYDGKPSGIYSLQEIKPIRSQTAREILKFIQEEYQTLPFCSRWLVNKFGTKSLFALRQLEQADILHQFNQLVEVSHKQISQAENTILIEKEKIEITTG